VELISTGELMNDVLILLVLLVFSGVFSGSETALIALSLGRVEGLAKEGRSGAQALLRLKNDPTRMLITILIGNNLVNIASASMATVVATRWFGDIGPGIAVGVLTILILIFGEITPKSLATRYAERISLFIAAPLLGLMHLIFPLVWLFQHITDWAHQLAGTKGDPMVTEQELISMAGHGAKEGTIEQGEREMIERIFTFSEVTVRDVMTSHDRIFALSGTLSVSKALPEIMSKPYSRIPIYEKDPDDIVKVMHLRDLLEMVVKGDMDALLADISHDVDFVPQYQKINDLFATLRRRRQQLAVVVDEFGVLRGIVTLEDLMEELFGEIYDESDTVPKVITRVSENEATVDGNMQLRAVMEFFDMKIPGKPTDTVNFWILDHVKRIPAAGDSFTIDGLTVRVEEASRRRINRVVLGRVHGLDAPD